MKHKNDLQAAKTRLRSLDNLDRRIEMNNDPGSLSPIEVREKLSDFIGKLEEEEKLDHLMQESNHLLFECQTVFPFDFFPDKVLVDETKISIIQKQFFATESVHSVLIKNIKDIQIQSSVFFASAIFVPDVYQDETITIDYLRKSEAYKLRRLVQGLVVCQREGIDLTKLDDRDLEDKVQKIGNAFSAT